MDPRPSPRLIAFSGPAGVGKSEASDLLIARGFVQVKFAVGLKTMLRSLYEIGGLDEDEITARLEGDLKEKPDPSLRGRSPRHAMQTLGGDWGRDLIAPDLWVSMWQRRVQLQLNAGLSVVVDDLRYPNEADAIRELGGEIIRIKGNPRRVVPAHSSELFDFDVDRTVTNNCPLPVFWDRVLRAVNID